MEKIVLERNEWRAKAESAEQKAESWERGHDYAWELKVEVEKRVAELEAECDKLRKDKQAYKERACVAETSLEQIYDALISHKEVAAELAKRIV